MNHWIKRRRPVHFDRGDGFGCYEVVMFHGEPETLETLHIPLLRSAYHWVWMSRWHVAADQEDTSDNPDSRDWTEFSGESASLFLDDIRQLDSENYGRFVMLVGLDKSEVKTVTDMSSHISDWMKVFVKSEDGSPVRVIVMQVGDQKYEYVFVWQSLWADVEAVLSPWVKGMTWRRRRYRGLSLARLEKTLETF